MKSLKDMYDMTNKIKALIAVVSLSLMTSLSPAYGAFLNGEISISGGFLPTGGTNLADATGIDFLEWDGSSYVSGTSGGSFTVASVSSDFASFVTPSPFILGNINDFNFGNSIASLWQIGGFSFDLQNSSLDLQNSTTITLTGSGEVYGNGYERTRGDIVLTGNVYGSTHAWTMTTTASGIGVPESASIYLLAFGLLGLFGAARRKV